MSTTKHHEKLTSSFLMPSIIVETSSREYLTNKNINKKNRFNYINKKMERLSNLLY